MVSENNNNRGSQRFRPLGAYSGLATGPNVLSQSRQARSFSIDGTKQRLRDPVNGSPFTIRVAPPDTLLDALTNKGLAAREGIFDPILREQFLAAERELIAVRNNPNSTAEDVAIAEQGLLGGRAPARGGQNIGIIDAAVRSTNNYGAQVQRRESFRQSNFFATGPTRGATLTRLRKFVAANGIQFNPQNAEASQANQAAISDLTQALDVLVQLNQLATVPSLTLLINPETMTTTYTKKQQYQDRSRFNYLFQSWGEEQVTLSFSGRSPGFVVGNQGKPELGQIVGDPELFDIDPLYTSSTSGYQYASKLDSAGWQNLMGLFSFYRNNGYIYDRSQVPRSEAHLFIGHIEISYDQFVYLGQFENFSYEYVENKQHGAIDYNFDFTVSYMFDNSQDGPVVQQQGPTPSPSAATRGGTEFFPVPETRATRSLQATETGSTAVLDPVLDPFMNPIGLLGRDSFTEEDF